MAGKWEGTELRVYNKSKVLGVTEKFKPGEYVLIFELNKPAILELNGKFECNGRIILDNLVTSPLKIDFCGDEYLLTKKSMDTFTLFIEESDGFEEYDFKRL